MSSWRRRLAWARTLAPAAGDAVDDLAPRLHREVDLADSSGLRPDADHTDAEAGRTSWCLSIR